MNINENRETGEKNNYTNFIEGSLLLKLTSPSNNEVYHSNFIPLAAWCMLPGEDNKSILAEKMKFRFFISEETNKNSNIDNEFGLSAYEIFVEQNSSLDEENQKPILKQYALIDNLQVIDPQELYVSSDTTVWGFPIKIEASLFPYGLKRNHKYILFGSVESEGIISYSNKVSFSLSEPQGGKKDLSGGPLGSLPSIIFSPHLILKSWAYEQDSSIVSVSTEVVSSNFVLSDKEIKVFHGLEYHECRHGLDAAVGWENAGIETHISLSSFPDEEFHDLVIKQNVVMSSGNELTIFLGKCRFIPLNSLSEDSGGFLISALEDISSDNDFIYLKGILSQSSLSRGVFILGTSRGLIELTHKNSCRINWTLDSFFGDKFGSHGVFNESKFEIVVPLNLLPSYPGSLKLYYKDETGTYPINDLETGFKISFLVNSLLNHSRAPVSSFSLRSLFSSLGSRGLLPHRKPEITAFAENGSNSEEPSGILIASHNLNSSEGAPLVAKMLLEELPLKLEIPQNEVNFLSFNDGPLRTLIESKVNGIKILEKGQLYQQTIKRYLEALRELRIYFRECNPKCLIVNALDSFIAVEAASRENIPCVWIIHESISPFEWYRDYDIKLRLHFIECLRRADKIVFVSKKTSEMYQELIELNRFAVIPNGIDAISFRDKVRSINQKDVLEELQINEDTLVMLSVGTTTERKGQDRTIKELKILKEKCPNQKIHLVIVGARDIPFLSSLKDMVREYHLTDCVTFIPETPDVHKFYSIANIFIINSREESFPLVTLEAFSLGLPLISTTVFGLQEIIRDKENALSFDGDCPGDLSSKIINLLENAKLREHISIGGLEYVEKFYTKEACIESYLKVIDSLH